MPEKTLKFLVPGGEATAGPPIGPALGPLGLNVLQVVEEINRRTSEFKGMRVPVEVIVDTDTKTFEVKVGTPTTAALIVKEAGIEKGSAQPNQDFVADLSMEQIVKIAKLKMPDMRAKTLKAAVKQVLGTCLSMGVTVEGKRAKEVIKEVDAGAYDELIKKAEEA
ncbi:MAG: 50S ribosomal protein L11 [Thaumarchaeota archaeon]|nr:MAG: 50S ribosomal protein L11 [Nitrososphaerota archaeon]RLG04430.1 MAG: 50S ribosomal protein L11 [Nitrososphaerota archaeon]HDD42980.1 50S ribosomal protein L11 [Nitrososphaeria archaeon]